MIDFEVICELRDCLVKGVDIFLNYIILNVGVKGEVFFVDLDNFGGGYVGFINWFWFYCFLGNFVFE